jgi:hypothetical protein
MRRCHWIFIAVSSGFSLLAGCQQQTKMAEGPAATAESKAGPKIEFESMVYDFGKVGPRKKLLGEFKFTNTGDAPLKITKVEKCCGAVTELDKNELAPGESGVLKVQYTSSRTAGKINKKLYVNSNDKVNPRAMLTIQAETVLRVDYEPKRIKLLLKDENAGCPEITLNSVDNKSFSITSFNATSGSLTAEFDSSVQAKKFVLQPKADMEKLQKRATGLINIGLAFSEPGVEAETVTIIFQAIPRFTLRPSLLVVMYDKPDEPVEKTLWLTNNYGDEFEVESTASKEGIIKVLDQNKVGNQYRFLLEITPPPNEDIKRFSDTFTINLKDGERLEVPCRGIYRSPATKKTAG